MGLRARRSPRAKGAAAGQRAPPDQRHFVISSLPFFRDVFGFRGLRQDSVRQKGEIQDCNRTHMAGPLGVLAVDEDVARDRTPEREHSNSTQTAETLIVSMLLAETRAEQAATESARRPWGRPA